VRGRGHATARLASVFVAASFVVGCGARVPPPISPASGGNPWFEVTTPHFVVQSDASLEKAREFAEGFEQGFAELEAIAFPRGMASPQRLRVIVLRDAEERYEYWPRIGGYSADKLVGELERRPVLVFSGERYPMNDKAVRQVFLHELTHRFVAATYGPVPVWLNEGLADYWSTLRFDNGYAVLGEVPAGRTVTAGLTPSVQRLVEADQPTFYGGGRRADEAGAVARNYYCGAWALVHFFRNGPDDERARFRRFVGSLDGRTPAREAWVSVFGATPSPALERGFFQYLGAMRWDKILLPADVPAAAPIEAERALTDVEIDLLWARLLPDDDNARPLARRALEDALRREPASAEVAYWAGTILLGRGRRSEAREQFERAIAAAPKDPRPVYGLLTALGARSPDARYPDTVAGLVEASFRHLQESATSPDQLGIVANHLAAAGELEEALRRADAAVAADPSYYWPFVIRARVHFARGRAADAERDQERALALLPEHVDGRAIVAKLAVYRAARAAATP
jgi:tetratricopeptide (TPR) repeat protein